MANIKSAKKRIKVATRNTLRNKTVKSEIKTLRKQAEDALQKGAEGKENILKKFTSRVDSAVSKGALHKNKAARLKSKMQKKVNKK